MGRMIIKLEKKMQKWLKLEFKLFNFHLYSKNWGQWVHRYMYVFYMFQKSCWTF